MNEYVDFGRIIDDDKATELYGYFAPNGDYYLCMHKILNERDRIPIPDISFRISMSGSLQNPETKKLLIDLIKSLNGGNQINI